MPLQLDNRQRKKLRQALISAFPDYPVLQRMVSDQLDENLATISSSSNDLETVAFDLVEWAEARGTHAELVMGAIAANRGGQKYHGHPDLLKFVRELGLTASQASKATLEKVVSGNSTFLQNAKTWRCFACVKNCRVRSPCGFSHARCHSGYSGESLEQIEQDTLSSENRMDASAQAANLGSCGRAIALLREDFNIKIRVEKVEEWSYQIYA